MTALIDAPCVRWNAKDRAGSGAVDVREIDGRSVATRLWANSPLKLLNPRSDGSSAWIISSTFGGGLVAGDEVALDVDVGERCSCLLGTQSATKVYRSTDGQSARQAMNVVIADGAMCIIAPHPVTCFATARFVQRQRIKMAQSASVVLLDWFTSGRHAAGERWAFDRYDSRTDIFSDARHVFRDALLLSGTDGPIGLPQRTGGFDCFAYAVVLGGRFSEPIKQRLQMIERQPIPAELHPPLVFAASPLEGGAIFRAAGTGAEIVGKWMLQQLGFVSDLLGCDRWSRMLG